MGLLDVLQGTEPEYQAPEAMHPESAYGAIVDTLREGVPEGQRNTSLLKLAGLLRSHGLSREMIEGLLISVNRSTGTGLPEKEIGTIARSVCRYAPKLENRAPVESDILTIADCRERFIKNRQAFGQCKTGYTRLDAVLSSFAPGEVFTLAGRSGTGKTNFGLQLSRGIARNSESYALFMSLEMDAGSVFFRLSNALHSEMSGSAKLAQETSDMLKVSDLAEQVIQANSCILTVDKDSLTLEQVEAYLVSARTKHKVNLCTIDYLGYLSDTHAGSAYEKVSRIAKGVKALAKRQQVRIILLCQTSRAGTDGTEPVQLHHLRDSGAIEESADYILGLWHSPSEETRIHCEMLKSRTSGRGTRFDLINTGLHLTEDDFRQESQSSKLSKL